MITFVDLNDTGRWAVTVSRDGTARIWDLEAPPILTGASTPDDILARLEKVRACLTTDDRVNLLGEEPAAAAAAWEKCEPELNHRMGQLAREAGRGRSGK
jgi:hypothetical protein